MYCFINARNGKYIGMDHSSGGYPYETDDSLQINLWKTIEEADKYHNMFYKEPWICKKFLGIKLDEIY